MGRHGFFSLSLLLAAGVPSFAHADVCLNRRDRQIAVANGQALRLNEALRAWRRSALDGRVLGAELCYVGVALVYAIKAQESGGKTRFLLIDAKTGQILSQR